MSAHRDHYQPIRLKVALAEHGIRQGEVGERITQPNGRVLSRPAINQLINFGLWPVTTPRAEIEAAVAGLLRERGVPEAVIESIWLPLDHDHKGIQPQHHLPGGSAHLSLPRAAHTATAATEIEPIGEPEMLYPETRIHFKIFKDPFKDDVQSSQDVFLSADQRYIREAMYTVSKHGGFLAVIGESGSGKTTLFNDLYERIESDRAKVIVATPSVVDVDLDSSKTRLTARRIMESLLSAISSERPRQSMQRLTEQVRTALAQTTSSDSAHSVVLMVEEAHSLLPATLKTLKRLLELKAGHRYLLGVILIGQPELSDLLNESHHPELREVIRRCEVATLMPLDAHLEQYIAHKLQRRNVDSARIFAADAYDAIRVRLTKHNGRAVASELYPLMVNNLIVKAMNQAARIGEDLVTAEVIQSL